MARRQLRLDDTALALAGAVCVEQGPAGDHGPTWLEPWRIDASRQRLFEPALIQRQRDAVGVRLSLMSDTTTLAIGVDPCLEVAASEPRDQWTFDLLVDGVKHQRVTPDRKPGELVFQGWSAGEHRFELYLYQMSPIRITSVAVDDSAQVRAFADDRPKWLVYGSSITQCGQAAGPSETWPALVATELNLNHTNIGYGGNANLDLVAARMMAQMPADYISICFNVNNYGVYTSRIWRAAVIGFILTVREGHPDVPIACVSPIFSSRFKDTPSKTDMTLPFMREQVADAIDALRELGDTQLHYVDGLDVFGPDQAEHMPDGLHPDAQGCRVLAKQYTQRVMPGILDGCKV